MMPRKSKREVAADSVLGELFNDGMPPDPPSAAKKRRRKKAPGKATAAERASKPSAARSTPLTPEEEEAAARAADEIAKEARVAELSRQLDEQLSGVEDAPLRPFNGELPEMAGGYRRIVEHVFDIDPWAEYQSARDELQIGAQHAVDGVVKEQIDRAEHRALRAKQLEVNAKFALEGFRRDQKLVRAAMWDEATAALQKEKDQKLRSKAITNDDVEYKAIQMFPDEWRACEASLLEAELMVEKLEYLSELWASRCSSLRKLKG